MLGSETQMTDRSDLTEISKPSLRERSSRQTNQSRDQMGLALLIVVVFLSPMNYIRSDLVYFTLGDLFCILTFTYLLARGRLATQPFGKETSNWYIGVALFLVGLTLGSVVNGSPITGLNALAQYTFSWVILPMIIMSRSHLEIVLLIRVFVFSMVCVMLHGAYVVNFDPENTIFISGNGRMSGLIERENAAGVLGAVAIVFTLWLYILRYFSVTSFVVAGIVILYGILLTGSNTGFLLVCAGVLTLSLLAGSIRLVFVVVVVGSALVFFIYQWGEVFLPEVFQKRVLGAITNRDIGQAGTFEDRLLLIREALSIARESIWIGLGVDQHRVISAYGAPVHNTFILTLTEGGILSLTGLVFLMITASFIGWKALRLNARLPGALSLTYVFLFALILNGFTHVYARFWAVPLLLALAVSVRLPSREEKQSAKKFSVGGSRGKQ